MSNVIDLTLSGKLSNLKKGQRLSYYCGEAGTMPATTQKTAMRAYEDGAVTLYQRKVDDEDMRVLYEYIAEGLLD